MFLLSHEHEGTNVNRVVCKKKKSEEEDTSEDSVAQEELFAMIQQFWKGKIKGQIQGKGEGEGVCWSCGESDHYSRDCPNNKQDGWTDLTSWKDQHDSGSSKS